jgi:hypothetical protein
MWIARLAFFQALPVWMFYPIRDMLYSLEDVWHGVYPSLFLFKVGRSHAGGAGGCALQVYICKARPLVEQRFDFQLGLVKGLLRG